MGGEGGEEDWDDEHDTFDAESDEQLRQQTHDYLDEDDISQSDPVAYAMQNLPKVDESAFSQTRLNGQVSNFISTQSQSMREPLHLHFHILPRLRCLLMCTWILLVSGGTNS